MAEIFKYDVSLKDIFNELEDSDIVGIYGSRLIVRKKMKELYEYAKNEDYEYLDNLVTSISNSDNDEVAIIYNGENYDESVAEEEIMNEYRSLDI